MTTPDETVTSGTAAGVPYVARPPASGRGSAPLVVAWHLMDPPASEAAMAAALPLHQVDAWRVYFGLPWHGSRLPAGGPEELYGRAAEDAVLKLYGPVFEQGAAELPAAVAALRAQLPVDDGPIGILGGSAGGAVALLALAESELPISAAAVVNPISRLADLIAANEERFGVTYDWTEASRAVAARLDFPARAADLAKRDPQPAILLVEGAEDDPAIRRPLADLWGALSTLYSDPERIGMVTVPGMQHALAEPPGLEPAPQTADAAKVDATVGEWFARHL